MMHKIFIGNTPVDQAIEQFMRQVTIPIQSEWVTLSDSVFRKTFVAVHALKSSPDAHVAAMDGIAVISERTNGASEKTPKQLIENEDFVYVNTGNLMPEGYDSVIMIEEIVPVASNRIEIMMPSYPWQHVRQIGEDIIQGEMILPSNHVIRPLDLGAMLSGGIDTVCVYKKRSIGILPTGNEIVQSLSELKRGKIIDSSSKVFEGYAKEYGALSTIYPPAVDDFVVLQNAIKKGIEENDILITIAGSSAGAKDFTVDVIESLGRVIVHGVAMKPGKPTILGLIDGKPVIGLPGYPVSSYFTFDVFVKPLLTTLNPNYTGNHIDRRKQAVTDSQDPENSAETNNHLEVTLTQRLVSSLKHEEYVRMLLGHVDGKYIATPLNRGAGSTMSLVRADAILKIPQEVEGIESGSPINVTLIKNRNEIDKRLVVIGSHDLILDFIADKLPLSSGHVGSMGGILAIKRNEAHIAPVHLIDEKLGTYNLHLLKQYFSGDAVCLIEGVRREQGIFVKPNNPKNIQSLKDLQRDDVAFVNRQRGSGTRQLLDFELAKMDISPETIYGYKREVNTHMAVAVSVLSEGADAGLGIRSAAEAFELDFIPIGYENYDFLVREKVLKDPRVKSFIELLKSDWFREALNTVGGYALESPGLLHKVGEI